MPHTPEEVQTHLSKPPDWSRNGDVVTNTFSFKAYLDEAAFVNRVANAAEAVDHLPGIALSFRRVTVTMTTHSGKGITQKDFPLATESEGLA